MCLRFLFKAVLLYSEIVNNNDDDKRHFLGCMFLVALALLALYIYIMAIVPR